MARLFPTVLFLSALLAGATGVPAAAADMAKPKARPESPFELGAQTPHHILARVDTAPARAILSLLTGGADAPATLKILKASTSVSQALKQEGMNPDDFFGRLVAAAAGTPDALLATYSSKAGAYRAILDALDADGSPLVALEGQRIAGLLPTEPLVVTAELVYVPFFSVAGFADVMTVREGDKSSLFAELPRIAGESLDNAPPRETMLKLIRSASAEGWISLFNFHFRKPPVWPEEKSATFEVLLARTVAEGPATLFLFPDEFFPITALFEEPILRSFARWNHAVDGLVDPKKKESERSDIVAEASRGDFWGRYTAIVGAQMAETLIRQVGRGEYLKALAAGPRAVATLYLTATKGTKVPTFGKTARKELEHQPAPEKAAAVAVPVSNN
ncbi:MAG: hypothetical protein ABIT01_07120 [Thermoanaerobaculia bacterium]